MKTILSALLAAFMLCGPALADGWNAIVVDRDTLSAGIDVGAPSKADAEREAKEACMKTGKTCGIVHTRQGGCVAISRNHDGSSLGFDMADTIQKTVVAALDDCFDNGKYSGCTVHTNACAPSSS
jgi:hypothetical protein